MGSNPVLLDVGAGVQSRAFREQGREIQAALAERKASVAAESVSDASHDKKAFMARLRAKRE